MIKIIIKTFLSLAIIYSFGCSSKPEPNLELFSPEAFAFDVGDYWEVNATINAKGFEQKEKKDFFEHNLFYSVDMITADTDTFEAIFEGDVVDSKKEEVIDVQLEAQIEVDSSFSEGKYILIFNVTDQLSKQKKSEKVELELTK